MSENTSRVSSPEPLGLPRAPHRRRVAGLTAALLLAATPVLGACTELTAEAAKVEAVKVEKVTGSDASRITLTAKAAERLGVRTEAVAAGTTAGQRQMSDAAVLYDPDGTTFTYTSPKERVFVRSDITIVRISDGIAYLSKGPSVGTKVVTVGAALLFGVETGVGGGH